MSPPAKPAVLVDEAVDEASNTSYDEVSSEAATADQTETSTEAD